MILLKRIAFLLFFFSGVLPSASYAASKADQMNKFGKTTKVIRVYTGKWKGWDQHDRYIKRDRKSFNKSRKVYQKAELTDSMSIESVRKIARRLKITKLKNHKRAIKKTRITKSFKSRKIRRASVTKKQLVSAHKPAPSKMVLKKISSKDTLIQKTNKVREPAKWTTVNQGLPLLMKVLSTKN